MKDKLNKKTVLIIVGALLLIAVSILLFSLFGNKNKFKDNYEEVENNIKNNLGFFKTGYVTEYSGIEKLFEEKNIDIKDLNDENKFIYTLLSIFASEHQEEISDETYEKIQSKIENVEDYMLMNGSTIKNEMKKLLNIDWNHTSITNVKDFIYNIEYVKDADVYIITPTEYYEKYSELDTYKYCEIEIIESTSTFNKIKTTIAVAYIEYPKSGNEKIIKYYSDKDMKNLVFEVNTDDLYILDDNDELIKNENVDTIKKHIDKFDKYVVTSTKENDKFFITNIKQK